VVFGGDLIVFR